MQCLEILSPKLSSNDLERALDDIERQEETFARVRDGLGITSYIKRNPDLLARTISVVLNGLSDISLSEVKKDTKINFWLFTDSIGYPYASRFFYTSKNDLVLHVYTSSTAVERIIIYLRNKVLLLPPPELKEFGEYFDMNVQRDAVSKSLEALTKLDHWFIFILAVLAMIPFVQEDMRKDLLTRAFRYLDEYFDQNEDGSSSTRREWNEEIAQTVSEMMYDSVDKVSRYLEEHGVINEASSSNTRGGEEVARVLIELAKYISPYEDLVEAALRQTQKLLSARPHSEYLISEVLGALGRCLAQYPPLLQQVLQFTETLPELSRNYWNDHPLTLMPRIEAKMAIDNAYSKQHLELALEQALRIVEELPIPKHSLGTSITKGMTLKRLSVHLAPYPRLLEKGLTLALTLPPGRPIARDKGDSQIDVITSLLPTLKADPQMISRVLDYLDASRSQTSYTEVITTFKAQLSQQSRYQEHVLKTFKTWEHWVELGYNLSQIASQIGVPKYPSSQWIALLETSRQMKVLKAIHDSAVEKLRYLTFDAVSSLDQLLCTGQIAIVKDILPYVFYPNKEDSQVILKWIEYNDETIVRHAALLLAEAGHTTPRVLVHLTPLLKRSDDRIRYRAARSISGRQKKEISYRAEKLRVSDIGQASAVKLAELLLTHTATPRIATVLEYALKEIVHDDISAIRAWIQCIAANQPDAIFAKTILMLIHFATPAVMHTIAHALRENTQQLQETLFSSLTSLLQNTESDLTQITQNETIQEVRSLFFGILASGSPQVKAQVLQIINLFTEPTDSELDAVLNCADERSLEIAPLAIHVYASLVAKLDKEHQEQGNQTLQRLLQKPAPIAEAAEKRV